MCLKFLIIILCCALVSNATKEELIDSGKYMLDVTQQFIHELEDYGLCNTKILDINQTILATDYFGYEVKGDVKYTNGFLHTLQEVKYFQDPQDAYVDPETNSAHMEMKIIFVSLMFLYDYHAYLTKGNFSGTVAVPIDTIDVTVSIDKYFLNDDKPENLKYKVDITGHCCSAKVNRWYYEPSNHYTEIINKGVTADLGRSVDQIEDLWTKLLGKAIQKIPFPKVCFMC